jgi:hypothetical protein
MRISSQSSQFIFNLPSDILEPYLDDQFKDVMDKNFIPYDSVVDYLNSTIKEIVFPSLSFETKQQVIKRGKLTYWKDSKHVMDNFNSEIDITFRSVDSNTNYFILLQIMLEFYLNTKKHQIPFFSINILDKDGALIYTIIFEEAILKSLSEVRLSYNHYDITEKIFTLTFKYNFIDIIWNISKDRSVFDTLISWTPLEMDRKYGFYNPNQRIDNPDITDFS